MATLPKFPKPGQVRKSLGAVKVYRDGREVCRDNAAGKAEYRRRTLLMAERQGWICPVEKGGCGRYMTTADVAFDHEDTRGMGGGRRDDRIQIGGNWFNQAMHGECNRAKGSVRVARGEGVPHGTS